MKAIHSFLLPTFAGLLLTNVLSLTVKVPLDAGIKGSEEIGPIDNFTCPSNGAFPHPDDCDLFILCWDGSAVLNRCTEDMLYDLRYNGCNHAEYTDCGDRYRPPGLPGTVTPPLSTTTNDPSAPTSPTTPAPNGTFDCPANGVFPHEKCEYYWNCFEDQANLVHCELNYLYDLRYNGCNFPEYVDCGDRERPEGVPPTVTPPVTTGAPGTGSTEPGNTGPPVTGDPGDFQCPSPEGSFPDPESCEGYYTCVAGIPFKYRCPDGLHFNPDLSLCDWPSSAGCELAQ